MSDFDFARPSGVWAAEMVPGARDVQWWDSVQSKALNGDLGGLWTPKTPVIVGGAGMQLGSASQILGGVTTRIGGRLISNGVPTLNARGRTVTVPALACTLRLPPLNGGFDDYIASPSITRFGISFLKNPTSLALDIPRRYLHQGALLASVVLNFVFPSRPAALPSPSMMMSVLGHDYSGNAYSAVPDVNSIASWAPTTAYATGTYINPSSQATNRGYYMYAHAGGTSGGVEPAWPTVPTPPFGPGSGGIVDGGVTWYCIGRNGWLSTYQATADTYYAGGAAQTLGFDTDLAHSVAGLNTMDNIAHGVSVLVDDLDPLALLTSVKITYQDIVSMAFE